MYINDSGSYSAKESFVSQIQETGDAIILNVKGGVGDLSLIVNVNGTITLFDEKSRKEIWAANLITKIGLR